MTAYFALMSVLTLFSSGVQKPSLWRSAYLGNAHGKRITAAILVEKDADGGSGVFFVAFHVRGSNSSRRRHVVKVGQGLLSTVKIRFGDYVGLGRKQVFISAEFNGVSTVLLDYDGRRIRKLYEPVGGRVWVTPIKPRHGSWRLREVWPKSQWDNHTDLGIGVEIGKNAIRRMLHWNGHQFVPDRPGPSRIRKNATQGERQWRL